MNIEDLIEAVRREVNAAIRDVNEKFGVVVAGPWDQRVEVKPLTVVA